MYAWLITLWSLEVGYCTKLTLYRISYHSSQAVAVNPQTQQNQCDVVSRLQNACMTYCSMTPGSKFNLYILPYFAGTSCAFRVWSNNECSSSICYIWQITLSHMTYCSITPGSTKLNLHWISYHILLVQDVLLEFGRPMNTAEAPVRCSRQTSKTSDIGLSKTNNKIGNLGRSQNPRQKATGPRGYNTILWSIAVTIDSKTYKHTEFYYLLFYHYIVTYQAYFWHPPFLLFFTVNVFFSDYKTFLL